MSIVDRQYGAELVTDKGRVMKYDAAECMAGQLAGEEIAYRELYAVAYDQPGKLLPVDSLTFVIDSRFRSPMGADLAAFTKSEGTPHDIAGLNWAEVMQKLGE
jgi:copper chaperone NosL